MATNKYVNATREAGGRTMPGQVVPGRVLRLVGTYEKTAADTNASILRIGTVPANAVPLYQSSQINNDALAGATVVDVGIYEVSDGPNDGVVVDADLFSSNLDIAAGNALASPVKAFQTHPTIEEFGLTILALTNAVNATTRADEAFDIALTGDTFGVATGTIAWDLSFLVPQQ